MLKLSWNQIWRRSLAFVLGLSLAIALVSPTRSLLAQPPIDRPTAIAPTPTADRPGPNPSPGSGQTPAQSGLPETVTNADLAHRAEFNQIETAPIAIPPPAHYQPIGEWVGRLILPAAHEYGRQDEDWVWLELAYAPQDSGLRAGDRVRLAWAEDPGLRQRVDQLRRSIRFGTAAAISMAGGNVHPVRLAGRDRVGPLQSLAGARPWDDLWVRLDRAKLTRPASLTPPTLRIDREPVQVADRWYGLVQVVGPSDLAASHPAAPGLNPGSARVATPGQSGDRPGNCPGGSGCSGEFWRVRHFNRSTGRFDGPETIVRFPQQPPDHEGRFKSTPRQWDRSTAGQAGWYIWGSPDRQGIFTIRAIAPRHLFRLEPQAQPNESRDIQTIQGRSAAIGWVRDRLWSDLNRAANEPGRATVTWLAPDQPIVPPEGSRALVVHVFGGIGGPKAEPQGLPGSVTGHFAFGLATVVREPLTGEREWRVTYEQIYAHNPEGIVAGRHDWSSYTGDLERGWLGSRPIADGLIWLPALDRPWSTSPNAAPASLLDRLSLQLETMAARYRTGDGTGSATVSPASSCVQDSNQALWWSITTLPNGADPTPASASPSPLPPDLVRAIVANLAPLGLARPDWQANATAIKKAGQVNAAINTTINAATTPTAIATAQMATQMATQATLAGIDPRPLNPTPINSRPIEPGPNTPSQPSTNAAFRQEQGPFIALGSWRTMFPRQAHDDWLGLFLSQGAEVWLWRSAQVGGIDPTIAPLAPTGLFGQWMIGGVPVLTLAIARTWAAFTTGLGDLPRNLAVIALGWGILAATILPLGRASGLIWWQPLGDRKQKLQGAVLIFFLPALAEEWVFRVLLLPHPAGSFDPAYWWGWAAIGLVLFLAYHPLQARLWFPPGRPTFYRWDFLLAAAFLGSACTAAYQLTGSIWVSAIVHWLPDWLWLYYLGGLVRLGPAGLPGPRLGSSQEPPQPPA